MMVMYLFFLVLLMFLIFYQSLLFVLVLAEFFSLFIYFLLSLNIGFDYSLLLVFSCFMVLEAVIGLSLLLMNYRFLGVKFYGEW